MLLFAASQAVAVAQPSGAALTLNVEKCRKMALASSEDVKKGNNSLAQSALDKKIAVSASARDRCERVCNLHDAEHGNERHGNDNEGHIYGRSDAHTAYIRRR